MSRRDPADPDNAMFLAQIKRGQVPKELVQEARGSRVNLMMEDCSTQEYQATRPKLALFGGTGHRLGRWVEFCGCGALLSLMGWLALEFPFRFQFSSLFRYLMAFSHFIHIIFSSPATSVETENSR